jgi:hypothetical protein
MPLDVPLHESHRGYIRAAAATLTQAGIPVTDVDFLDDVWDDGEPIRCAQLHLARLATMQVYGVRKVWLSWTEESGWDFHADAPDSIIAGLTHPLCDQVLPAPAELLTAVQAALAELPEPTGRPYPSYRYYGHYDEAFEIQLDTYIVREDEGMGRVLARLESYAALVPHTAPGASFPGKVERDSVWAGYLLALARRLAKSEEEAVERTAWHLAVTGLWCPRPAEHHAQHEGPPVPVADVDLLLALEIHAGHYSRRGLAARYAHLGVTRDRVRAVLWSVVPEYMRSDAQRLGPRRLTLRDPDGNRSRRRKDRRYVPLEEVQDPRLHRLRLATDRWRTTWSPGA